MTESLTLPPLTCAGRRQDIRGISALSWDSRHDLYGNYICHTFQGGSWADRSPLHEAAFQGRLLSLHTLIAQGFNVNIATMDRVTPLHEACLGGHVTCAKLLLEHGANVNAVTINGATPLFNACVSGSTACVNLLLQYRPTPDPAHLVASPLHEAARRGHRECMEILIAHGANIDLEISQLGTPLYAACVGQRPDCVEKLLQIGADVHRGRARDSPLHAAAQRPSVRVVELLMEYGADVGRRNSEGRRPVELAEHCSPVERALRLREGPSALSQLCRLCVRRSLGRSRLHTVPNLPLPHLLRDFLLYR
ncbi:ankyrin repeat and SOCS box protein 11 [Megalops cyprinoides]|uniref:ankyrin repeat and SOCS box protein 11 n=1 Tax=Megalops cyprinoides TaxID=118141 RepID=UPI00186448F1|nr:ankyrin repeat and SOCS box protein 11 [Megalops cyprinoides]